MRKIGITGDIKEMFHQILIRAEDQDSQRFLWREGNASRDPDVYVMQVMTFGSSCSPCVAQYVKNVNAMEFKEKYQRAVEAILNNHYVDDMIESVHTEPVSKLAVLDVHENLVQVDVELSDPSINGMENVGNRTSEHQNPANI